MECSGVLVGNYLITAGHIMETIVDPFVRIDNANISLDHS